MDRRKGRGEPRSKAGTPKRLSFLFGKERSVLPVWILMGEALVVLERRFPSARERSERFRSVIF